jgi:hypothetical protein
MSIGAFIAIAIGFFESRGVDQAVQTFLKSNHFVFFWTAALVR